MSQRKNRILIVAPTFGIHGGIEAFSAAVAREIVDDFEVRVVFRLRQGRKSKPDLIALLDSMGVPYEVLSGFSFRILRHIFWADLINCHFPLVDVTFPARVLGKKLALTIENRRVPQHRFLHRWGLGLAHRRWYISRFVGSTWEGGTLHPDSAVVPAVSDLPSERTDIAARQGFLFIARWVPRKGLEELIEAYGEAKIDHALSHLILVGDGPLKGEVMKLIAASPARDFIDVKGFVSPQEKHILLSQARWNVAPATFEEDLGLTPIEARACGVPSIVSNIGGLPEAGGPSALLCKAGDVSDLTDCIEKAAGMSEDEYMHRSQLALQSLTAYLPRKNFYVEEFQKLLRD